jgi:hypothetical protein
MYVNLPKPVIFTLNLSTRFPILNNKFRISPHVISQKKKKKEKEKVPLLQDTKSKTQKKNKKEK